MKSNFTFYCEDCTKNLKGNLYGEESFDNLDEKEQQRCLEFAKHFHWCFAHRTCVKCGNYLKSQDIDILLDGRLICKECAKEY